ncbi:4028_t:CDS:2 [Ambispora gerdemannii]|uniref:4028_t:CDS:1 n=1 Tax=Ambispora gerdemannii TaxID=144530 RepID=A0A9N9FCT8_9GLOM|nr:4028_t:CDS:2 [Ambispora gerdemannii]
MGNTTSSPNFLKRRRKTVNTSRYSRCYAIENTDCNNLPNNDEEVNRMEIQSFLHRHMWKKDFSSPIEEILNTGAKILDIGCGDGAWLAQMATEFPRSSFLGLDISAIDQTKFYPGNLSFIQSNVLDGMPFENSEFDYVHMQMLSMAFTEKEWNQIVIPEMIRITKSGGFIEIMEVDLLPKNAGPNYIKVAQGLLKELQSRGINGRITELLPRMIESTKAIVNIQQEIKTLPIGSWGGEVGEKHQESTMIVLRNFAPQLAHAIGIPTYQFNGLLASAREEMDDEWKTFVNFLRIWGQKV